MSGVSFACILFRLCLAIGTLAWMMGGAVRADASESDITVLFNPRPPFVVADEDAVSGLIASPAAKAFRQAGFRIQWSERAPPAQLRLIEDNLTRVCAIGWFHLPERENWGRFSRPVYRDRPPVILARADDPRVKAMASFSDLLGSRDLTMGVKSSTSYGRVLDARIASALSPRIASPQDGLGMVRMLLAKRFDYMIVSREEADFLIGQAGSERAPSLMVQSFRDMPAGETRHILCSFSITPEEMARIDRAIAEQGRSHN